MSVDEPAAIVFIVVDALRARNLSCYGYRKPTSPNIDRLAKGGVLFENAFCCSNTTDPSITSIFSGLYPISHAIVNHGTRVQEQELRAFSRRAITLLPERLKTRGYTTLAADCMGRWHKKGYDYYYDHYQALERDPSLKTKKLVADKLHILPAILQSRLRNAYNILKPESDINAASITDRAMELVQANHTEPLFLYIHYWDVHFPYLCKRSYYNQMYDGPGGERLSELVSQLSDAEWRQHLQRFTSRFKTANEIVAKYDGAIAFVDSQIGRLIAALERQGILDRTLVLLTSDHGESLTEHGIFFDHHGLYDQTIHVPLIVTYPPRLPRDRRVGGLVQHVDLLPTILELIGGNEGQTFDGQSVIPLIQGRVESFRSAVYAEETWVQGKRAIRTKRYKYIQAVSEAAAVCRYCGRIHGGLEELYDLHADPLELTNILDQRPRVAEALREHMSDCVEHLHKNAFDREKAVVARMIRGLKTRGRF